MLENKSKSLAEMQNIFESVSSDPNLGLEDAELSHQLDFKHKDKQGQYMCVVTLSLFNLFMAGYNLDRQ